MQDLRLRHEDELSLLVFNTYDLYCIRHSDILFKKLSVSFRYTHEQLTELLKDLEIDMEEMQDDSE